MKPIAAAAFAAVLALTALPAASADPPKIADLAWMIGDWAQTDGDRVTRETWLPASGKAMFGVNQLTRGEETRAFEFLMIVEKDGALTYVARPNGGTPTGFKMTGSGPTSAVFENPEHDFPQKITYERCGEDLCAEVSGTNSGQAMKMAWRFKKAG